MPHRTAFTPSRRPVPRPARGRVAMAVLLGAALFLAGYALGALSLARNLWPIDALRTLKRETLLVGHAFDARRRLVAAPGKTAVECPPQRADTAVLLVTGQSNAANHAERRLASAYPTRVVNFHAGHCVAAASPLLGATGADGEFATPLADALVRSGTFREVVLIAAAVAESSVRQWQAGGELNAELLAALREAAPRYRVTHVVWHQGETDAMQGADAANYTRAFASLRGSLAAAGVDAPMFIAVATRCGPSAAWRADNPIARAQRALVDDRGVFLGADTDALLTEADRRRDACHLAASGQRKVADAYAAAIGRHAPAPR